MDTQDLCPEYESVETFAEFLMADDRESFTYMEADTIATGLKVATYVVIDGLKEYGFGYEGRTSEKRVRGFRSNSHDRWCGPGSMKSHGGSGHEQITGFGGQKG
jgi:hypothetical protein